jgi:hypothetical protein
VLGRLGRHRRYGRLRDDVKRDLKFLDAFEEF